MSKKRPLTRKQRRKRKIILFVIEIIVLLILIAVLVVAMKMGKINRQDINEKEIKKNKKLISTPRASCTTASQNVRSNGRHLRGAKFIRRRVCFSVQSNL